VPPALVALGYVAVFSSALAFIAYFGLLEGAGAIRGNLVFYVVPAVATVAGWALLGEQVAPTTGLGFGVIFLGFLLVGREPILAEAARLRAAASGWTPPRAGGLAPLVHDATDRRRRDAR
jgi:drug/metabolite transporter (DMT)-like permease